MALRLTKPALAAALLFSVVEGHARSGSDGSLHSFLQRRFPDAAAADGDARYASARADLNGDGRAEAVVRLQSRGFCGSGGCALLVLTPERSGWRIVTHMTITNPPIRLLRTSRRGWRDLSVRVRGGGIAPFDALLRYDGRSYPVNPSLAPSTRAQGRLLIADTDEGRRLYR